MSDRKSNSVLIIGAGIAGVNAALRLAEMGRQVYLCESKPYIGGMLSRLDRWFPDNHCGLCQSLPLLDDRNSSGYCLRRGLFHPGITVLVNSRVKQIRGGPGNFVADLVSEANMVSAELCTGCGLCEQVCPVENPKAIRCSNPVALNKSWIIDVSRCTRCGLCVSQCPSQAIDLDRPEDNRSINIGSIILSSGFEEFDPLEASAFGYHRYPNVVTGLELEDLLSKASDGGLMGRPSDGKEPQKVAFLQCIGSRNLNTDYCSSVCCMYALKEAIMLEQHKPQTDITIFFMDMRAYGKYYHRYYEQAQKSYGIKFERCRVPVVNQDFSSADLLLAHCGEDNLIKTSRFDMIVLSVGQKPFRGFTDFCRDLGIDTDRWGYCVTEDFSPVLTSRPGIYVCGTAAGPRDITGCLVESTAAAGQALLGDVIKVKTTAMPEDAPAEKPGTVVFVCNCYNQLSETLDIASVISSVNKLPGVLRTFEVSALCHPDAGQQVLIRMHESGGDSLVIAACPKLKTMQYGDYPAEIVDLRESLAWVHSHEMEAAADKALKLIRMSLAKLHGVERDIPSPMPLTQHVLVVGGGLAGIEAARSIAAMGIEVDLIEKSDRLGGNALNIHYSLSGEDIISRISGLIEGIKRNPSVHLKLNAELVRLSGHAGDFHCEIREGEGELYDIHAGAIVIAVGAEGLHPKEYLYGKSENIITQSELEVGLADGTILTQKLGSLAMIQCVGSRDSERPYCSRLCCNKALKNALLLKGKNPQLEITIFYRDIMSYGLNEKYYTQARQQGILFVRYGVDKKPVVSLEGSGVALTAMEPALGQEISMRPDFIVLSPAILPHNTELARVLNLELTPDGFFKEAEAKFRPLDMLRDGIYMCGMANSPMDIRDSIIQAQAAAQRAVSLLSGGNLVSQSGVSTVNERWCSGCEICISVCPYQARVKDMEKGVVKVLSALCRGCGACVAACPNGAASLKGITAEGVFFMLDAAV